LPHRIFLLSPANLGGIRGRQAIGRQSLESDSLGEVFTSISSLYFRGKRAYATAFASPPPGVPGSLIITQGRGLLPMETAVSSADLLEMSAIDIDLGEPRYLEPFVRDVLALYETAGPECEVVLLGSIATPKYVHPLLTTFGTRLLFPSEFVGRGDMSRGGLMLRHVREGVELDYIPVEGALRRGPRPPKLPKLPRG
jgi:hypothetical protein